MGNSSSKYLFGDSEGYQSFLDDQLDAVKNDTINPIAYKFFLMNFFTMSRYPHFYELPLNKIAKVFDDLGAVSVDEAKTVMRKVCQFAREKEELLPKVKTIINHMVVKIEGKDMVTYLPVDLDQKLFSTIVDQNYDTGYGKFRLKTSSYNWNSHEIEDARKLFLSNKQKNIPIYIHSKEIAYIFKNNPIYNIWIYNIQTESKSFNSPVSKPTNWEPNIHEAAAKGIEKSVLFTLYTFPPTIDLPDMNMNTPAHIAAKCGQIGIIKALFEHGADFTRLNKDGHEVIHCAANKATITAMNGLGIDLNKRDKNGKSLIDIKGEHFDKESIRSLIQLGVNILEPNPYGTFWIQTMLHYGYYENDFNEPKFIEFIYNLLLKNKGEWSKNKIFNEIISRKKDAEKINLNDLEASVENEDVDRISILLALGIHADIQQEDGKTLLMRCAEKGLSKSAKILGRNYCRVDFTNEQRQNTFWVATCKRFFDTAIALRDCGANMDALSMKGYTLLHYAYEQNITDIFNFLLEAGASPNIYDVNKETVQFIAYKKRDDEIAEMIQDKYKGDINVLDNNGNSLLHYAFIEKDFERMEYYWKRGMNMDVKNENGRSILFLSFMPPFKINYKLWDFLLDHGSKINTTDARQNSILHLLIFQKKLNDEIFDYLISKKIDINAQNDVGMFPISAALLTHQFNLADRLLGMKCKIKNPKSEYEPLAIALDDNNKEWFEKLLKYGADATNEQYPIIANYIYSSFFDYNVFSSIKNMNMFNGAPIQAAIYTGRYNVAKDIFYRANNNQQERLAKKRDSFGRTPLCAIVIKEAMELLDIFLQGKYPVATKDNYDRTPLIYACIIDNNTLMNILYKRYTLNQVNICDIYQCSALSYAAENRESTFCNQCFCDGVDVRNCAVDNNGIITHYRSLLYEYGQLVSSLEDTISHCRKLYSQVVSELSELEREYNSYASSAQHEGDLDRVKSKVESANKYAGKYNKLAQDRDRLYEAIQKYESNLSQLKSATRRDMLYNMSSLRSLASVGSDARRKEIVSVKSFINVMLQ